MEILAHFSKVMRGCTVLLEVNASFLVIFVQLWNEGLKVVKLFLKNLLLFVLGVRGGAVGRGTALKAGRSRVRFRIGSLGYSVDLILVLGSTQPLTEINTRGISWGVKSAGASSFASCLEILGVLTFWGP